MAGLLLMVLMGVYAAIIIWLLVIFKPLWMRATVLTLAVLIPTADDVIYRLKLAFYCNNEAGFQGVSDIPRLAGIYFDRGSGDFYFNKLDLDLVEWKEGTAGNLFRLTRDSDNVIKKEKINKLISKYEFSLVKKRSPPFLYQTYLLREINSKTVVSEFKDAAYYGGWFRYNLLGSLSDSGPTLVSKCYDVEKSSPTLDLLKNSLSNK